MSRSGPDLMLSVPPSLKPTSQSVVTPEPVDIDHGRERWSDSRTR
ncbi:hypothetical protein ACFY04_43615 [Streptomyces sp. NPDC001549]